ncbi:MAG: sulfotransferase [Desulfobacterales bacterium]|nr:sulfotransferase [Desulfobacterales bacterium]
MSKTNVAAQKKKDEIVFIVSSGRAGTTLLRTMLNAGGELHIPHESDFVARAYKVYGYKKKLHQSVYLEAIKFFKRTSQNSGWGLPEQYIRESIINAAPRNFKEFNISLIETYLKYHNLKATRYGIKAPVLISHIDRILDVFPDAKIIHVVRDGRDVHLSYRKLHNDNQTKSFGPKGILSSALYWVDGLRRVSEYSSQIYEVCYEELLNNPAEELKKLCHYLEIPYSPIMHDHFSAAEENKDALLEKHKQTIHLKITQGIDSNNQGKYLKRIKRKERFLFEFITAPYLNKYHYPLEYPFLENMIFCPFRKVIYMTARLFNNIRYRWRDKVTYKHTKNMMAKESNIEGCLDNA